MPPAGPLIVRTGALTLAVRPSRLTSTFDQISGQAMSLGGFVQSSSQQGTGRNPVASLVLRVPSDRFDALLTDVAGDGRVRSQQVTGQDVTGQSIDLAARIRNLQSEEAALRGLMTRAGSIHSILALQNEFFGVESDAEQLASQRGSLLDRATDGTLSVVLVPLAPTRLPVRHHENVIVRGAALAARNTVTALRAVALALGWAFPLLAVAALAVGSWWWWRRRLRRTTPAGETR